MILGTSSRLCASQTEKSVHWDAEGQTTFAKRSFQITAIDNTQSEIQAAVMILLKYFEYANQSPFLSASVYHIAVNIQIGLVRYEYKTWCRADPLQ